MSDPGKGKYSVANGVYTFSAEDAGTQVKITYSFAVPSTVDSGQPTESLALTLFAGARDQSPWGYLATNHPDQALNYRGLAYVAAAPMDLGVSATLPNLGYEVLGLLPFGGGIPDANPADVLSDIWTDVNHGLGLDPAKLGDLTQWSNFCVANGIFLSPAITGQQAASELLQELLEVTNSTAVWSDGVLKIIPYGDTTVTGNGATFTPATTPVYDLTDDDFVSGSIVQLSRLDLADAYNAVQIEWVNRANAYNTEICEEKSETAINKYGLRIDTPRTYHSITTQAVAALAANAILRRNIYIVATYTWKTDWRYALLEPMDLVTITVAELGLTKTPVRITRVTENADGTMDFEAEEFPWGTAQPTAYPKQPTAPYVPQDQADPGFVNAPILFESTSRQANYAGYELNIAVSGSNPNWGGANIWASADGATYQKIGQVKSSADMGILTAALPAGADPDTTDTLAVDLSSSLGQLQSMSDAEADNNQTLCYVDGELICFGTATLTAANRYNLTYLRRGVFGTANASHASGAKFCRLDSSIFIWDLDPDWVGKTIHVKFTSFNAHGKMEQSLAAVTEYTYSVAGSGPGSIGADGVIIPNAIDFAKNYVNQNLNYVGDTSDFVRLAAGNAAGNAAYNFKGVWSSAVAYAKADEVIYGASYWLALSASTNSTPATGSANWQVVGSYSGYEGAWSSSATYAPGAEVTHAGNYWVCLVANTNSEPSITNANWQVAGPGTLDDVADGDPVHGYLRMPGANMDGNRRGLVDLSSPGHLNLTAEYLAETLTRKWAGQTGADVTASNPQGKTWLTDHATLVSEADSITRLSDLIADNIAEGTTRKWAAESGATVGAAWGSNLTGRPTELTDGRIAAGLDGSGNVARNLTSAIKLAIALTDLEAASLIADNLAETATRKWAAESGADVTAGKSLTVLTDRSTSHLTDDAGLGTTAVWTGVSGAGKPADNATVGATWGTNVGSIPGELTDGRIAAGLDGSGNVARNLTSAIKLAIALTDLEAASLIADNLAETASRKWAGESGADVTSDHAFLETAEDTSGTASANWPTTYTQVASLSLTVVLSYTSLVQISYSALFNGFSSSGSFPRYDAGVFANGTLVANTAASIIPSSGAGTIVGSGYSGPLSPGTYTFVLKAKASIATNNGYQGTANITVAVFPG